jgi:ABC-type transport system involved in multi-copper enzyme maturation permease subunit
VNAQSIAIQPTIERGSGGGMFLGFRTVFRKEMTEWLRGKATLIVAAIATASAIFTTLVPFVVDATGDTANALALTMDPTTNVLLGWKTGQTIAVIAVLATMALVSVERDRGTLAWNLTNPVSPTSIIAAKFSAAMLVIGMTAIVLPLAISIAVATVAYGGLPDLGTVGLFALLFLTVPAFYIGLNVAVGTVVKSTVGVAGIAFAVMLLPLMFGGLLPIVNEISPTSIGTWAMAVATGATASTLTLVGWLVSMVVLVIGAKVAFDRQEF